MARQPSSDGFGGEHGDTAFLPALTSSAQVGAATGFAGMIAGSVAGILRGANPVLFAAGAGMQCFGLGSMFALARQTILARQPPSAALSPASGELGATTRHSTRQTIVASGVSGSLAGACMGALRGRANVVPGAVFWGATGVAGQVGWNWREKLYGGRSEQRRQQRPESATAAEAAAMAAAAGGNLAARLGATGNEYSGEHLGDAHLDDTHRGDDGHDEPSSRKDPFWLRWTPMRMLGDAEYEGMLRERLVRVEAELALVEEDLQRLRQEQRRGGQEQKGGEQGKSGGGGGGTGSRGAEEDDTAAATATSRGR